MDGRTPIGDLVGEQVESPPVVVNRESRNDASTFDEIRDLRMFATMAGYESMGFDGDGRKAEEIYAWAKEMAGLEASTPMDVINGLIKSMRTNDRKGLLMNRLYQHVQLDSRISDLKRQQRMLHD